MRTLLANIKKELLLLFRDKTGLAFLFFMPIVLVVLMTVLQDSTVKKLEKEKIDIILVNLDTNIVGKAIREGLDSANVFNVIDTYNGEKINLKTAQKLVKNGLFDFALFIPENATKNMRKIVRNEINKQVPLKAKKIKPANKLPNINIKIFFNPVIKGTFRQAITSSIHELIANVQTQIVFKSYTKFLKHFTGKKNNDKFPANKVIVEEHSIGKQTTTNLPNSTQHNVPAWTIFAIFFIVIPLSGQIISERVEGTLIRLKSLPVHKINFLFSRIIIYSTLAVVQAALLLLLGKYFLPTLGVYPLNIEGRIFDVLLFTFIVGLAATSYGLFIAVLAKTQHQAGVFGSISVVLMAALGGIFIPTYVMSESMQTMSKLSPLNWALNGYYDIFLNNCTFAELYNYVIKLLLMFLILLSLAIFFDKRRM